MANFNFNKVIIGGRITADPERKTTPSGTSVTTFTVAVNRRFGSKSSDDPQTDFITVTAWRQTADFICNFFKKGSSICIVGSIQTRTWTDNNGQKRYATEVIADEAHFVDAKGETAQTTPNASQYIPDQYAANMPGASAGFREIDSDDELPFN